MSENIEINEIPDIKKYIKDSACDKLLLIPSNYEKDNENKYYSSTASAVKKILEKNNVPIEYNSNPEALLEQRGLEWYGPIILISSLLYTQNPQAVSLALSLIANYVTEIFSTTKDGLANLTILFKNEEKGTTRKITYKGPSNGIKDIEKTIKDLCELEKNEN